MKLTLPQQDIYFEQLLYPKEPIYNIGAKIEIKGALDVELLKKAYSTLIDQHDAYRISFAQGKEGVEMTILEEHHSELKWVDFSSSDNPEKTAHEFMQAEFIKAFDLFANTLLHRFILVKVSDTFHYLFSVYHHIITDGWGTSLMFQRFVQNYNELVEAGEVQTEYPFSYQTYAEEEEAEYQDSEAYEKDKAFWVNKFENLPESLLEKIDPAVDLHQSSRKELVVERELYNRLEDLAKAHRATTFHVILAALYLYFGRKHQNKDFAIGLPVLNRSKRVYKKTVGLFMGVSPLRIQMDFSETLADLIKKVKGQLRQDYRHQRFPLGKLIQELQVFKEKEKLFNISLSYEKQDYANNFSNTQTRVIPMTHQSERVALAIYIREFDEKEAVKIDFDYNLNYFDNESIGKAVDHFDQLLQSIPDQIDEPLKDFSLLTNSERKELLKVFNQTATSFPQNKTLLNLWKTQVSRNLDKAAVQDGQEVYTYQDLDQLSEKIAAYLITSCGIKEQSPIAVLLDRSVDLIAVLLGILKAGRSYIPLDPTFPEDRLNYILRDSQTRLMIKEKAYDLAASATIRVLDLGEVMGKIKNSEETIVVHTSPSPADTAYIIYTSGSTGNPKGVEIGHRSLLNFLTSMQAKPGIGPKDILFSVTTYSFDISILEFFTPLLSGATLHLASQAVLADPQLTIQQLAEVQPTVVQATPSFYQLLFNAGWEGEARLRVLCGGDLLSESLAAKLLETCGELWNMYGPTETTIWSSCKQLQTPTEAGNIGRPINNTLFYILDEFLQPLPLGTRGAIYIGGDGLAKGYYHKAPLTKEKFIPNPFMENGLIYETGDVGAWTETGEIQFLGRNDNQVKIRGYRIELGDIETHLHEIEGVKDAVVVARKGAEQAAYLVAYVILETELKGTTIVEQLQAQLPAYMIPYAIIPVEEFPLTPNQKVNRKALAQREIEDLAATDDFEVAQTHLEKKLKDYWQQALDRDQEISIHDNFFSLGGHSLNAVKLLAWIQEGLSLSISLKSIFDYPTIHSLARYLQTLAPEHSVSIPFASHQTAYRLSPAQYTIWLAAQQEQLATAYHMPAAYLLHGTVDVARLNQAVNTILAKHENLRTNFIEIDGLPYQKIKTTNSFDFAVEQYALILAEVDDFIQRFIHKTFDLEQGALLRMALLQLAKDQHVLVFCTHHLIMDGWSLERFVQEFALYYNQTSDAALLAEKEQSLQFKDYSEWLLADLEKTGPSNEMFWESYLDNYNHRTSIEPDFVPAEKSALAHSYTFAFKESTIVKLRDLAVSEKTTLNTILTAALKVLLFKYSGHRDLAIGTVNSGRNNASLHEQLGMFAKTLVLRTKMSEAQHFIELIQNIQNDLFDIDYHQDLPSGELTAPVFDLLLVFQNPSFAFDEIHQLEGLQLKSYPVGPTQSRLPITINILNSQQGLQATINYNSAWYAEATMQIIGLKFQRLLEALAENPFRALDDFDIRLDVEKEEVVDFDLNF